MLAENRIRRLVARAREHTRSQRELSPVQKQDFRLVYLVVFSMLPFLLLMAELPLYVPDITISDVSAVLLGIQVPLVALASRIVPRWLRNWALGVGFIGIFLSANAFVLSKMQTGFRILSTDVATLDFKTAGMIFALAVGLNAIGLILGKPAKEPTETPESTEP